MDISVQYSILPMLWEQNEAHTIKSWEGSGGGVTIKTEFQSRILVLLCILSPVLSGSLPLSPVPKLKAAPQYNSLEFFESRIRPLLANNCFACHTSSQMGGLQMDSRENLLKGGKSG